MLKLAKFCEDVQLENEFATYKTARENLISRVEQYLLSELALKTSLRSRFNALTALIQEKYQLSFSFGISRYHKECYDSYSRKEFQSDSSESEESDNEKSTTTETCLTDMQAWELSEKPWDGIGLNPILQHDIVFSCYEGTPYSDEGV